MHSCGMTGSGNLRFYYNMQVKINGLIGSYLMDFISNIVLLLLYLKDCC